MYSVVLMMAMTGGAEAADFGRRNNCHGCNGYVVSCAGAGCHGGVVYSCSGSYGCNGSACHGCNGRRGLFGGGLFGRRHGCNGNGCNGCHGYNNCCGPVIYSCHGMAGCYGAGCHGVIIGPGCHGVPVPGPEGVPPPGEKKDMPPDIKKISTTASATILVNLPADSTLTVDGTPTTSTGAERRLVSPALPFGRDYSYTLTAEINQDGQSVQQTQRVTVRAGQETRVSFTPTVTTASR